MWSLCLSPISPIQVTHYYPGVVHGLLGGSIFNFVFLCGKWFACTCSLNFPSLQMRKRKEARGLPSSPSSLSPTAARAGQGLKLCLSQIYKLPSLGKGKAKGRLSSQLQYMQSHLTLEDPQQTLKAKLLLLHAQSYMWQCYDKDMSLIFIAT